MTLRLLTVIDGVGHALHLNVLPLWRRLVCERFDREAEREFPRGRTWLL